MRGALLEARSLSVRRGKRRVLEGIDLELSPGEAVALVGPNAAGKSTLLRALAGLLAPEAGGVWLRGRPLPDWPRAAVARSLALVAAEEAWADALRVRDRVALGRYPHRGPFRSLTEADERAIDRALELTGITPLAGRPLGTLSAGERQLAALARALAQQPSILLLDEPAAHLDIGHELALFRILEGVRRDGVAVLAVVHDLGRAAVWAARMVLVAGGRIAAGGSPDAVLSAPECRRAFGIAIRGHAVEGVAGRLWSFEEEPPPGPIR